MPRRADGKRVVSINVLPGQPTDGSGRVCIHLVVRDPRGPFVEPHVLHPKVEELPDGTERVVKGVLEARPTRMRLACDPRRTVAPVTRNGVTTVTPRTEELEAVTCLKCIASVYYKEAAAAAEVR